MISTNTLQIQSEINQIKQSVRLTREQKEKVIKYLHNSLIEVNIVNIFE
jgi:hypothetical protein